MAFQTLYRLPVLEIMLINKTKLFLKKHLPQKLIDTLIYIRNAFFNGYASKSYSQEGEDMILRSIFGNKPEGFYIDVGAYHPFRFSNTYCLYKRGWKGINIDATPGSMKLFKKFRERDINIEAAISNTEKLLTFYIFNEPALNGFSKELSLSRNNGNCKIIKNIKIKTQRLESILERYLDKKQQIDFITIDVEGLDFDVLKSNNWEKYRPKIVLVEILDSGVIDKLSNNEITKFMRSNYYTIYAKTMRTVFFLDMRNII